MYSLSNVSVICCCLFAAYAFAADDHTFANSGDVPSQQQTKSQRNLATTSTCNTGQSALLGTFLVHVNGDPSQVTTDDTDWIGTSLLETYNDASLCARQLNSFTVKGPISYGDTASHYTLEFEMTGTCSGCNVQSTLLSYGILNDDCPCEGPSRELFDILFNAKVGGAYNIEATKELHALTCPAATSFSSSVVVGFTGCTQQVTQNVVDQMAQQFMKSYNFFNNLPTLTCDRVFRQVESVTASFDPNEMVFEYGRRRTSIFDDDSYEDDYVDDDYHNDDSFDDDHDDWDDDQWFVDDNISLMDDDWNDDDGDSSLNDDNIGRNSRCDEYYFEIRFDVAAVCRGCSPGATTLFDDPTDINQYDFAYDRRLVAHVNIEESLSDMTAESNSSRHLQSTECQCPIDSNFRALSEYEMEDVFEEAMLDHQLAYVVEHVIEIKEVQCAPTVNEFGTTVDLFFGSDSENISTESQKAFVDSFVTSYNDLSQRFCDPLFRHAQNVESFELQIIPKSRRHLLGTTNNPLPPNFKWAFNFVYVFRLIIAGNCRFCPPRSPLFGNDGIKRRLTETTTDRIDLNMTRSRRLVAGEQCYCSAVNAHNGAPSEREFQVAYQNELQRLSDTGSILEPLSLSGIHEELESGEPDEPSSSPSMALSPTFTTPSSPTFATPSSPTFTTPSSPTFTTPSSPTFTISPSSPLFSPASFESSFEPECRNDNACIELRGGDFCVAGQCLHSGSPRITLEWEGDDDLDLSITTPGGRTIDYNNQFDPDSRGVFDTTYVETHYGDHVESIYFPGNGLAPGGKYDIVVDSYAQRGDADSWHLQIFDEHENVLRSIMGVGSQHDIVFDRQDGTVRTECSLSDFYTECCSDSDCGVGNEQCLNRQCAPAASNLMFSMTYFGNDDYELVVVTPDGDEIYLGRQFDNQSGGTFEEDNNDGVSEVATSHTELVHFDAAPPGEYTFFVYFHHIEGVPDMWKLAVDTDAGVQQIYEGSGDSEYFVYVKS